MTASGADRAARRPGMQCALPSCPLQSGTAGERFSAAPGARGEQQRARLPCRAAPCWL